MSGQNLSYGLTKEEQNKFIATNMKLVKKYMLDFKKITLRIFTIDEILEYAYSNEKFNRDLQENTKPNFCPVGDNHFLSDLSLFAMTSIYFPHYYSLILQYQIIDKYSKENFPPLKFTDSSMNNKQFTSSKITDTFLICNLGIIHDLNNIIFVEH